MMSTVVIIYMPEFKYSKEKIISEFPYVELFRLLEDTKQNQV